MLTCLLITVWFFILAPPIVLTTKWGRASKRLSFPWGSWGGSLLLLSFFVLPWLNLQPLKHIGFDWLMDVAPPVFELLFKWLGAARLSQMMGYFWIAETLFEPRGWLALLLTATPGLGLSALLMGSASFLLAQFVSIWQQFRAAGILLMGLSSLNLLILFYHLPDIDGLGERAFPSVISLAIPVLGAHIEWIGPAAMIAALCLMFYAGAQLQVEPIAEMNEDDPWTG